MEDLQSRLRAHVDVLAELIGERNSLKPAGIEAARDYLYRKLTEMGYTVVRHPYKTSTRAAENLEVLLPTSKPNRSTLVIGSHYDTAWGTPGADDNASAVAINLEIARSLMGKTCRRPVRIVFFDCEEPPHFHLGEMGSEHHARQCHQRGEKLWGMICLESLGYFPDRVDDRVDRPWYLRACDRVLGGNYVVIVSDLASISFGLRFVWTFATSGGFRFVPFAAPRTFGAISLSDHRGYWAMGYRALMITNTAMLRNPNYHQPTDRLATLNLPRMSRLCSILIRTVRRMT